MAGKLNVSHNCLDRYVKRIRDLTDLPRFTMYVERPGVTTANLISVFHFR
jgi:hypothetical protein